MFVCLIQQLAASLLLPLPLPLLQASCYVQSQSSTLCTLVDRLIEGCLVGVAASARETTAAGLGKRTEPGGWPKMRSQTGHLRDNTLYVHTSGNFLMIRGAATASCSTGRAPPEFSLQRKFLSPSQFLGQIDARLLTGRGTRIFGCTLIFSWEVSQTVDSSYDLCLADS